MKTLFDVNGMGYATVSNDQATFYNGGVKLQVGTTIIVPEQIVHTKDMNISGRDIVTKQLFGAKFVNNKFEEWIEVGLSQFTNRTFGTLEDGREIIVVAKNTERGIRGERSADTTNIVGPNLGVKAYFAEEQGNVLIVPIARAYNVNAGYYHAVAKMEQTPNGVDFSVMDKDGESVLDLEVKKLPQLESTIVPKGYEILPEQGGLNKFSPSTLAKENDSEESKVETKPSKK